MKAFKIVIGLLVYTFVVFAQKPELKISLGHSLAMSVAITPDGKYALSGGIDGLLKLWDLETLKEIKTITSLGFINSVAITPDANYAMISEMPNFLSVYDLKSGKLLKMLEDSSQFRHSQFIFPPVMMKIAITPDMRYALNSAPDTTGYFTAINLWNISTGNLITTLQGHSHQIVAVDLTPDGKYGLSGSWDSTVIFWDLISGKEINILKGHRGRISSVAITPDGRFGLSSSLDSSIILWDLTLGRTLNILKENSSVNIAAISANTKYAISGNNDGIVKLWDVKVGSELVSYKVNSPVQSLAFTPDGKCAVIIGTGEDYFFWNFNSERKPRSLGGQMRHTIIAEVSPDLNEILVGSQTGELRFWDLSKNRPMLLRGHSGSVNAISVSPDWKYALSGSNDSTLKFWDLLSKKVVKTLKGHSGGINSVAITPDAQFGISGSSDSTIKLWDLTEGQGLKTLTVNSGKVHSVSISDNARYAIASTLEIPNKQFPPNSEIKLYDLSNGYLLKDFNKSKFASAVSISPDGKNALSYEPLSKKGTKLWDLTTGDTLKTFNGLFNLIESDWKYICITHEDSLTIYDIRTMEILDDFKISKSFMNQSIFVTSNLKYAVSSDQVNTIKIWDLEKEKEILDLVLLDGNDWVAITPSGLFDATPRAMKQMYYVMDYEIIDLRQLKERYYEPGLIQKVLGYSDEPLRGVTAFNHVDLYPEIDLNFNDQSTELNIELTNRGGGIGKTMIYINGKEVIADVRGENLDPLAESATLTASLEDHPYLIPGQKNEITVKAYNAEGYLVSRGVTVECTPPEPAKTESPNLFIVSSGVSDYTGTDIDLRFAAKDATDIASALQVGANRLFGTDNTYTYLLTTDEDNKEKPTKENITKTFTEIAQKAKATDVLVVYLAGHGINWGGQDGDFYYLTQDAYTASSSAYDDPAIRQSTTLSSNEIVELIKKVPALKQVLIVDACFSGKVVENLMAQRDIPSSTLRALDRMKDRTGMHIITGCTADAVSYEASRYGQGLLTYSLIEGIKGAALREDKYVDINNLFQHARERVPNLAEGIGGIQQPEIFSPFGSESFDIGELTLDDKSKIQLAQEKPIFVRSSFQDDDEFTDVLELSIKLDDALREMSGEKLVFVDAPKFPGAYKLVGQYSQNGARYVLQMKIQSGDDDERVFVKAGSEEELVRRVLGEIEKVVK